VLLSHFVTSLDCICGMDTSCSVRPSGQAPKPLAAAEGAGLDRRMRSPSHHNLSPQRTKSFGRCSRPLWIAIVGDLSFHRMSSLAA